MRSVVRIASVATVEMTVAVYGNSCTVQYIVASDGWQLLWSEVVISGNCSHSARIVLKLPDTATGVSQVHSQDLNNRTGYLKTWEGPARDDDQYLSYSAAVGEFSGNGRKTDVALGVPKGLNYTGKAQQQSQQEQEGGGGGEAVVAREEGEEETKELRDITGEREKRKTSSGERRRTGSGKRKRKTGLEATRRERRKMGVEVVGVSKSRRQRGGKNAGGGSGHGSKIRSQRRKEKAKGSAVRRNRRVVETMRRHHYGGKREGSGESLKKRRAATTLVQPPQRKKREGTEERSTTLQQDQRETTNGPEERPKQQAATPSSSQQHHLDDDDDNNNITTSWHHSYLGRPNTVDPIEAGTTLGLSWQEWFKQTGYLFIPDLQEGYQAVELEGEQDMLGAYAVVAGHFDRYPGVDFGVAAPRAHNSLGK
ncbi:hypothetical protein Pcinc_044122, partial [Petrolisthes cinctipes]